MTDKSKFIQGGCLLVSPEEYSSVYLGDDGVPQVPLRVLGDGGRIALLGARCADCGALMFPRRLRCVECFGTNLDEAELSNPGCVMSFTTVRQAPPGYKGAVPYVLGQVEIEGVTVLAHLTGQPLEDWSVGDRVVPCGIALNQEEAQARSLGYGFRPAPDTAEKTIA